jgi:hypothetical protein
VERLNLIVIELGELQEVHLFDRGLGGEGVLADDMREHFPGWVLACTTSGK